jgi:hypothetical protein
MKRLITTDNGGFPLVLDDFRWIESGLMEALKGIISPFLGNDTILILSGCVEHVGSAGHTISNGYVYIDGEICRFNDDVIQQSTYKYFKIDETAFDTNGDKIFQVGGVLNQTYAIRPVILMQENVLPSGAVKFENVRRLKTEKEPLFLINNSNMDFSYGRILLNNMVYLNGSIIFEHYPINNNPIILPFNPIPIKYRPYVDVRFLVPILLSNNMGTAMIKISALGTITLEHYPSQLSGYLELVLDGICYPKDNGI